MAEQDQAADVGGEGASELEEIAGLLEGDGDDDGGGGDGGTGAAGDDGGDDKPAPKPKGKPSEEKPKGEKVSWKEFRDKRKALDGREGEIERKARELEARERSLGEKAERAKLLDRLASGDGAERLEALAALGVDLDEVIAAQIDAQRGGAKPKPKSKPEAETPEAARLRVLEERLAAREESEIQRKAEDVFDGEASKDPILGKLSRDRRVELGHALASEYHAAGKPVPHPSKIPGLLAARLKAEYEEMRAIFEEATPEEKPRASGSRTLGRPDSKVRGGPRATIRTDDDELADITALLSGR